MSHYIECMAHDPDPNPWWFIRLLFPTQSEIPYTRFAFCRFINGTELYTAPPTVHWPSPALGGESVLCRFYFRMKTYASAQTLNQYTIFSHFWGRDFLLTLTESNIFSKWTWEPNLNDARRQIIMMFYFDVNQLTGFPNYVFVANYNAPNPQTQLMLYRWFDNSENTGPDVGWAPEPYASGIWPVPPISIFHLRPNLLPTMQSYSWYWMKNTGNNLYLRSLKSQGVDGVAVPADWEMFYCIVIDYNESPVHYYIKTFHNEFLSRAIGFNRLGMATTYNTNTEFNVVTAAVLGRFRILHAASNQFVRAEPTGNQFTLVPATEPESPYDAFEMTPVHGNYPFGS